MNLPHQSLRDRLLSAYFARGWRGFFRFYDLLKPTAARRVIQSRTRYGSHFLLDPHDSIDRHVLTEGFYESEVLEALQGPLAAHGAVLWVVGANFGLHAVTAKVLHPAARILAFEPSPMMASRVLENASLNAVEVELYTTALAVESSILPFHANTTGNPGMSTLHAVEGWHYDHQFHVSTTTASLLLENSLAPAPTALLVDAEGAEEEILRGFGPHLAVPTLRHVVFEAENDFLNSSTANPLRDLIVQAGFALSKLERREDTAHALSNFHAIRQ